MSEERQSLQQLAAEIRSCQKCSLAGLRTQAVPGEGPPDADLLFIGEGPGYHEDRQGRPFVGNSGQLLERLLATINLVREQVFIANVIKCRPSNNRDPMPQEIEACTPYLRQQIELLDPLVIVTLGRFSMAEFFPPPCASPASMANRCARNGGSSCLCFILLPPCAIPNGSRPCSKTSPQSRPWWKKCAPSAPLRNLKRLTISNNSACFRHRVTYCVFRFSASADFAKGLTSPATRSPATAHPGASH